MDLKKGRKRAKVAGIFHRGDFDKYKLPDDKLEDVLAQSEALIGKDSEDITKIKKDKLKYGAWSEKWQIAKDNCDKGLKNKIFKIILNDRSFDKRFFDRLEYDDPDILVDIYGDILDFNPEDYTLEEASDLFDRLEKYSLSYSMDDFAYEKFGKDFSNIVENYRQLFFQPYNIFYESKKNYSKKRSLKESQNSSLRNLLRYKKYDDLKNIFISHYFKVEDIYQVCYLINDGFENFVIETTYKGNEYNIEILFYYDDKNSSEIDIRDEANRLIKKFSIKEDSIASEIVNKIQAIINGYDYIMMESYDSEYSNRKNLKESFNDAWLQTFIFRPILEACEKYQEDLEVEFPELNGIVELSPFSSSNSTTIGIDIEPIEGSDLRRDFKTQIDIKEDIVHSKTMKGIVNYIKSETNKKLENSKFSDYKISKISWGGIGGSEVVKIPGVEAYFMRIYFNVEMNQKMDKADLYTGPDTSSWGEPFKTSDTVGVDVYRNDWRHDNRRG